MAARSPFSQCHLNGASMFAIFGGCATRDIFRVMGRLDLVKAHFACSTIPAISSDLSPHVSALPRPLGLTNFDRDMLDLDLKKTHPARLRAVGASHVILDLISERYPLLQAGGSIYTKSWIHLKYGEALFGKDAEALSPGPGTPVTLLPALTQDRYDLFLASLPGFLAMLAQVGVPAQNVILHSCLNAVTSRSPDAARHAGRFDAARRQNDYLSRLYEGIMRDFPEIPVFSGRQDLMVMEPAHAWGEDTVHYIDDYYTSALSALEKVVALPDAPPPEKPPAGKAPAPARG